MGFAGYPELPLDPAYHVLPPGGPPVPGSEPGLPLGPGHAVPPLPEVLPPGDLPADPVGDAPGPSAEAEVWEGAAWLPDGWYEWFVAKVWSGGLEIGINATEGNAEAFSSRVGANLKRKTELWEFKSDLTYAKSTANGTETQHNAIFNSGYERMFGESAWSHFGKLNLEYDEFKAFDLRLVMNAGLGYRWLDDGATMVKTRFGAGVSHEINSPDSRWVPEAVFGADLTHQLTSRQKLAMTFDYFPEWGDFSDFRMVTDASWLVALDDSSKLSLKLSVNERYDSTPNGRKPTDIIYALLLLWQL
jgi:putative salt-induced outer membrane protein YdiY